MQRELVARHRAELLGSARRRINNLAALLSHIRHGEKQAEQAIGEARALASLIDMLDGDAGGGRADRAA